MVETKQQVSEKINALLGTDPPLDFSRMKRDDLQKLYEIISKLPSLIQVGARSAIERVMEGPAVQTTREILNMPVMQRLKAFREAGGVLGLFERKVKEKTGKRSDKDKTSTKTS